MPAMNRLHNKNILLGISGGIAAYKSADLVRRLQDAGARVRVVMTPAACEFVTPLTFQALSGEPVHVELLDEQAEAAMGHIELARWADAILIAPASANTLAKLAWGMADNLLTTLCLASQAPLAVAPAMNRVMWSAAATRDNMEKLQQRGVHIFGPGSGTQACGETGEGRMLEPLQLVDALQQLFSDGALAGVNVLITAGPTYEAIDPVRFIGNRSSGRMGLAMAEAAQRAGANVTLVCGPCNLPCPDGITRIDVESARQMQQAVMDHIHDQQIFIATAAVADYRPQDTAPQKIKKSADTLSLQLQPNPDILAQVAALDRPPFTLGFAAETENLEQHARQKLAAKKLDMIAANQVASAQISGQDMGFNSAYNALDVFWQDGHASLPRADKSRIARQLMELVQQHYNSKIKTTDKEDR